VSHAGGQSSDRVEALCMPQLIECGPAQCDFAIETLSEQVDRVREREEHAQIHGVVPCHEEPRARARAHKHVDGHCGRHAGSDQRERDTSARKPADNADRQYVEQRERGFCCRERITDDRNATKRDRYGQRVLFVQQQRSQRENPRAEHGYSVASTWKPVD
jgi:hypothetical protein